MNRINLEALRQIVNEAFTASEEFKAFLKSIPSHYAEGWGRETYARYWKLDALESARWDALRSACDLIGVEQSAVIAFFKSINRYEKHGGRYDRCIWSVEQSGTYDSLAASTTGARTAPSAPKSNCPPRYRVPQGYSKRKMGTLKG